MDASRRLAPLILLAALAFAPDAPALQPLDTFVAQARATHPDARVARATAEQRDAEASVALGRLLPSVTASGTFSRNEYQVRLNLPADFGGGGPLTIQPSNQLDASLVLSVPIVDIGAWDRRSAAKATLDAATQEAAATGVELERRVTRAYFQLIAYEAVLQSAGRALDVAKSQSQLMLDRQTLGVASELDVQRAQADVARAEQDVAAATYAVATGRRSLATLSGIEPEAATGYPEDDLHEESPLAGWLSGTGSMPSVAAARAAERASEAGARAARAAWYPTLSANAAERYTNATSFSGHSTYYVLQATATWKLDATEAPAVRAQDALVGAAKARQDKTERDAADAVFQDWHQVRASIDTSRAARAQVKATALAAELALDRYKSGVATQLDLLAAQRDAFRAEVGRIQADADLAYARAALRLDSGQHPGATP